MITHKPASPSPLTDDDHYKIVKFLKNLSCPHLRTLGVELGLSYPKLKKMSDECLHNDMICSWLRKDDKVTEICGIPTWESLIKALEESNFTGIAEDIRESMLQDEYT